jgi:methionine-S-sulfoxide reductase
MLSHRTRIAIALLTMTIASTSAAEERNVEAPSGRVSRPRLETAVFAGGCFWCTELAFEQLKGVVDVEAGYTGGTRSTANYGQVHDGATRHAEAVRITYDPATISYRQLLDVFFDAHDPTQLNRQGEDDVGRQYRSAIFVANQDQKRQAEAKIGELRQQKVYKRRIATRLEPLGEFYTAELEHQNFARLNPLDRYIQEHAVPRACNVQIKHPELLKSAE